MVFWIAVQRQGHSCLAEDGKEGECFSCYTGLVLEKSQVNILGKHEANMTLESLCKR